MVILKFGELYAFEHEKRGIWYFSTQEKAAKFCFVSYPSINAMVHGRLKTCYGWKFNGIVKYDDVIDRSWIDPE